jgi:hypothetical protein
MLQHNFKPNSIILHVDTENQVMLCTNNKVILKEMGQQRKTINAAFIEVIAGLLFLISN